MSDAFAGRDRDGTGGDQRRRSTHRRRPPPRPLPLLRAALPRLRRRRPALGVEIPPARNSAPCSRGLPRCRSTRRCRRAGSIRTRSAIGSSSSSATTTGRLALAVPRDRRPSIEQFREFVVHRSALPAQGGRPAQLGDPAPRRAAEDGAAGGPGRRVRRRPAASECTRASSPRRCGHSASTTARTHTSTALPGSTLATVNLMSALGAAPSAPRRDRRPPGDVRDDLIAARIAATATPCAGSASARGDRLLRRARRGRRRPREHRRLRPGRRAGQAGAGARRRHPLRRPRAAPPRGSASPARLLRAWEDGETSLREPRPQPPSTRRPEVRLRRPTSCRCAGRARGRSRSSPPTCAVSAAGRRGDRRRRLAAGALRSARRGAGGGVRHLAPRPDLDFPEWARSNGVLTGVRECPKRAGRARRRRRPLRARDAAPRRRTCSTRRTWCGRRTTSTSCPGTRAGTPPARC